MSELLILEFDGVTVEQYNAVNKALDVQVAGPGGDWPTPLEVHVAATNDSGLTVLEVWDSQADQAEFMSRLGPALGEVGVPEPTRSEWLTLVGQHLR